LKVTEFEISIRQAIAKLISHRNTKRVIVTISYINILLINHFPGNPSHKRETGQVSSMIFVFGFDLYPGKIFG
jgi:hypothetical protein